LNYIFWLNTCIVLNTSLVNKCATKFSVKRSNPGFNPCKELFECIAHQLEVDVKDTIIWSKMCKKDESSNDFGWRTVR